MRTVRRALVAMLCVVAAACESEAPATAPSPAPEPEAEELAKLEALGYLAGYVEPPAEREVVVHDPARAYPGLNFFSSAHGPSSYLVDMEGKVLHEWHRGIRQIWPEERFEGVKHTSFWRRAHLYPNGDLLVVFEHIGIARLDRDSRVIWANLNRAHHDLEVLENGDIWVLTSRLTPLPRFHPDVPTREDFLTLLDPQGRTKREISLLEAIEDSPFANELEHRLERKPPSETPFYDLLHANTLAVLDGRAAHVRPELRRGNLLTSFRSLSAIAVIDPSTERAVWVHRGRYRRQHDPKVVGDDRLLLFDNSGRGTASTVLEYDLATMDVVWSYEGTPEAPFFSVGSGAAQRLPNGNTLITETMKGRAFEVTPDGEIVWELLNPNRTGKEKELIAGIWELFRLDTDALPAWLSPEAPER